MLKQSELEKTKEYKSEMKKLKKYRKRFVSVLKVLCLEPYAYDFEFFGNKKKLKKIFEHLEEKGYIYSARFVFRNGRFANVYSITESGKRYLETAEKMLILKAVIKKAKKNISKIKNVDNFIDSLK